jgi:uncharacterized membrane protein
LRFNKDRQVRIATLIMVLLIIAVASINARELRVDPQSGKIRILYAGDALGVRSPYPYMRIEPGMIATPIQTFAPNDPYGKLMQKQVRTYMPRTERGLKEGYDLMILSDANREAFGSKLLSWMSEGVVEDGLGIVMIGGAASFEGRATVFASWSTTTIADTLPVEMLDHKYCDEVMKMVIVDQEAELVRSLPWETLGNLGTFGEGHRTVLRQTAHLIAEADTFSYGRIPHLAWWDTGLGRGFAMTTDWTPSGGMIFMGWMYYPDFCLNVAMFTVGKKLPEDVDIVYMIRRRIRDYADIRATMNTMIYMVDKFGGNFAAVENGAMEIDRSKADADWLYFNGEYALALEAYDALLEEIDTKVEEARRIARQALFYVYLIEWAAVTGTFMLSGFAVYTLMIRRRMYAEVGITRLSKEFEE